jgi:hypothetical protein
LFQGFNQLGIAAVRGEEWFDFQVFAAGAHQTRVSLKIVEWDFGVGFEGSQDFVKDPAGREVIEELDIVVWQSLF